MDAAIEAALHEMRERVITAQRARQPLRLRGAGTKDFYGERFAGEPFDLRAYRGMVDYEPSELVLTARCGTPLSEIERALAECDQFLAFEPPAFDGDPTIGGVIAAGLSGPRRMYVGAARDFVLGVSLLGANGELLRFGGQVMKNVAGFDVSRLLCGSMGILGVITEVSLKVLPRPRAEETLRLAMGVREAVEAFNRWAGQPLPISGAAWAEGSAWLRLSGAAPAVRAARERIGGERVEVASAEKWWNSVRHCRHPLFNEDTVWRLSVPAATPPLDLPGEPLIDWGGALRWYAGEVADVDVRKVAAGVGGSALCWRGPGRNGRFHPLPPAVASIHRRLKQRFDPHGIFNPNRVPWA
ncbi:MAG: glycolate oxidase subunit GlcE [Gammaproteobacteria bacterium]|nr:MAG: glycolate oxidase subunit GlcE [Gammaproteobacteria bacterium]